MIFHCLEICLYSKNRCLRSWVMLLHAVNCRHINIISYKKMLLQSPKYYTSYFYNIDYSYGIEVMHVYFQIVNRTYIIGIFMIRKWINKLLKMTFYCLFFNLLLENSQGQWPCWTIAGSVDSATGNKRRKYQLYVLGHYLYAKTRP